MSNLESIARCGDVYCKNRMAAESTVYRDISNAEIQDYRSNFPVPCGPSGTLHDYVPFFFNPLSPMLLRTVNNSETRHVHRELAHIVTTAQAVAEVNDQFVFTTGHATMALSEYYDDLSRLGEVDWDVMRGKWWNNTLDLPNRKCNRQAEFLIKDSFPIRSAAGVIVFDDESAEKATEYLTQSDVDISVFVRPQHFYRGG
ncbi:MAG: DUF4433 domain-containing protein [Chloroflexi bacterium]|nr:DUF4433 domain-containing protein [Chloroflexota bacterium]